MKTVHSLFIKILVRKMRSTPGKVVQLVSGAAGIEFRAMLYSVL